MNRNIQLYFIMIVVFAHQSFGQSQRRFRHPFISGYMADRCRSVSCGRNEICDIYQAPCDGNCQTLLSCYPTTNGTPYKRGNCPSPSSIPSRSMLCSYDWVCPGRQLCCHGYRGSMCVPNRSARS